MTPAPRERQNRLLPYLLAILVILLAYVAYTRFVQPQRPAAVVQPPAAVPTPAPVRATATPEGSAQPTAAPSPVASPVVPSRPSGRANPFVALVTERPAGGAPPAPPPPAVPPPFFPGGPAAGRPAGEQQRAAGPKGVGVLLQDGSAVGIVEVAQKTYIVREGEVVEGFRVERIEDGRITLRRGEERVEVKLGGGEQP